MAFADPVALMVTYLNGLLTEPVYGRTPNPRPDSFVTVRRIGGTAVEPVRELVRLDVFAWALTDPDATALGNTVRAYVWDLTGTTTLGVTVYTVEETKGPSTDDDEQTGLSRSWATYDLMIRADDVHSHA